MGATVPPESESQRASAGHADPHEWPTVAPPAPTFEELLRNPTPLMPLPDGDDERLGAALDAGVRAGSSLREFSRMLSDLSMGLAGAKRANDQLLQELDNLRVLLDSANEQQLVLKLRVAELEQALLDARADAERDRRSLTEQHDEFLAALLDEHEQALSTLSGAPRLQPQLAENDHGRELSRLARQLAQSEAARSNAEREWEKAREALTKAQAQRDDAQALAERRERERDELRAEASQLRTRLGASRVLSPVSVPVAASRRVPSFGPPGALRLDAAELDAVLPQRSPSPRRPSTRPRVTAAPSSGWTPAPPPDSEPEAPAPPRSTTAPPPRTPSAASLPSGFPSMRPVLMPRLDPSTRPLTDYSLGGESLPSETLEGARISSKPPQK